MRTTSLFLVTTSLASCSVIRPLRHPRQIDAPCQTNAGTTTCGLAVGATASTVVVASNSQTTWTETYYPTTLSDFATLTASAPTTITTTDSTGETVIAAVFAAGVAWLAVPKAGLPPNPPNGPLVTAPPTRTPEPTSSTTSSSTTYQTPQTIPVNYPQPGYQQYLKTVPILYSDNDVVCTKEDKDSVAIEKSRGSTLIDDFCGGIKLNITVSGYPLCANNFDRWTIDERDCQYFLKEAQDVCAKSGGTVRDACLNWQFQPELNPGELKCAGKVDSSTGVDRNEAFDAIHDFCAKFDGSISTPEIGNRETIKQTLGNSQMALAITYGGEDCAKDGNEAQYPIYRNACERLLRRTIDDCDTNFSGQLGKFGGNVTDGCGVFSLTPQMNELTGCGGRANAPKINHDDALKAINAYCDRDLHLDPSFNPGNNFYQEPPDGASWDLYMDGLNGYVIKMDAQFDDGGHQTGCLGGKRFSTKGDECKRKLTTVIDGCGADGGTQFDNTQNGCVMWSIYGSKGAP